MKRKYCKYTVVLLFSLLTVVILYSMRNKIKPASPIDNLPDITAMLYYGGVHTVPGNYRGGKTVVVFFSPECDLCEHELNDILNNASSSNNRWVFITHAFLKDEMGYFLKNTPIDTLRNSTILLEDSPKYHTLFQVVGPPSMFVYDNEGKLMHSAYGSVNTSTLIEWIK